MQSAISPLNATKSSTLLFSVKSSLSCLRDSGDIRRVNQTFGILMQPNLCGILKSSDCGSANGVSSSDEHWLHSVGPASSAFLQNTFDLRVTLVCEWERRRALIMLSSLSDQASDGLYRVGPLHHRRSIMFSQTPRSEVFNDLTALFPITS